MTLVEVLAVLVFCIFALLLPVSYGLADCLASKSREIWFKHIVYRETVYFKYPYLEPKWHKRKKEKFYKIPNEE